jgi:hypothetical protein
MSHDQLARLFPNGRTVHVPADGTPLSGYELARADIEKRDSGTAALTRSKPSFFAALFGIKSNDDEDEGASVAVAADKSAASTAAAASAKSAEVVPVPRAKPRAAAFQLASADAQLLQPARSRQAAPNEAAEARPQTPADIINSRGFWDDIPAPKQASPAQVAAISARRALNAADSTPTASVSAAFDALAYAPLSPIPVGRSNVVAASAPIPRNSQLSTTRTPAAITVDTVVAKGPQGQGNVPIAASARLAASVANDVWTRVMILAPSASDSMNTTVLGDTDLTSMRRFFAKPASVITMSFSGDPQMGMVSDRFSGSATAALATQSFVLRTASLR